MAFNEIDPVKGFETIRAYTTGEGSQSAFIHHGTPCRSSSLLTAT